MLVVPHFSPPITITVGSAASPPRGTRRAREERNRSRARRTIASSAGSGRISATYPAPSSFAAARRFFVCAVGGFRPSSFSPWRLTQITGTFIFSSGATSAL